MKNIDGWSLRQPVFAIQLENIERENFDRLLAKCHIRQYFPLYGIRPLTKLLQLCIAMFYPASVFLLYHT